MLAAALAFGAPLVMSDVGGFGELHRSDGVGELVPSGRRRRAGRGARPAPGRPAPPAPAWRERSAAAAAGPLSWDSVAERTEAVYRELTGE